MTLKPTSQDRPGGKSPLWPSILLWGVAVAMLALAVFLVVQRTSAAALAQGDPNAVKPEVKATATIIPGLTLPQWSPAALQELGRSAMPHTTIPDRPSADGQTHVVETGDSVFGLADEFKLKPETVLWANYSVLKDNPDMLSIGQTLLIPPTNGVYYKWKDGDTLEKVAGDFKASVQDILLWPGNHLDLVNPVIQAGTMVMIPNGKREFVRTWVLPTIPRGPAGVTMKLPGSCDTSGGGAYGTGRFIWPGSIHSVSGNDYWSGHLAIDIAAFLGMPVVASDSGVVVYAGWDTTGYGNVIMIDHGNGYQTLYAHLSAIFVKCGQSVYQGGQIAAAGSTGNSTGPHIHFEIRFMGGFVNPHSYLPR